VRGGDDAVTELTVFPDFEAAAAYAAAEITRAVEEALADRGAAHLCLAGGETPRRAYELLGPLVREWSTVELWYGDERCVEPTDPSSNHRLVASSLLGSIPGPPPVEHRIEGERGAGPAARGYEALLRERVPPAEEGGPPAFDFALLGLGEDGHTASLFPGLPEVDDDSGWLCLPVLDAPKPPPERVTLSLPVLRAARRCVVLAVGAAKASAVAGVLAGPDARVPASLLSSDRLEVVVDTVAGGSSGVAKEASGENPDGAPAGPACSP
jgi:6-phosphogluconolactonase